MNAETIIKAMMQRIAEEETRRGIKIDWMSELPKSREAHSAREIIDAMGAALDKAGIPNNLTGKSMIVKKRVRTFRAWQNVEGSAKPEWVTELEETDDGSILGTMPLHLQLAARQCRRGEWLVEVQPGFVLSMSDIVFHTAYEPAE